MTTRAFLLAAAVAVGAAALPPVVRAAPALALPYLAHAQWLDAVDPDRPMRLSVELAFSGGTAAADYAMHVSTPGDALHGRFLAPAAFRRLFAPGPEAVDALRRWAARSGLALGTPVGAGTIFPLTGSARAVQSALDVELGNYRAADGSTFFSAGSKPSLPPTIAAFVVGIAGLDDHIRFAPLARRLPTHPTRAVPQVGTGPFGAYSAQDLRSAYAIPPAFVAARQQTVALFEQGGFDPNDVAVYDKRNHVMPAGLSVRTVDGFGGGIIDQGVALEAVLDIDMIRATNPAAGVMVYEDGAVAFEQALADTLGAIADDDLATTVSVSYGAAEDDTTLYGQPLIQLAAQGQAVFASAGDSGTQVVTAGGDEVTGVLSPASQPLVTGVGGTTLITEYKQSYGVEQVWNELLASGGATGGGISAYVPIPSYQIQRGGSVAVANGGSATMRNVPDVAAVGDPYTGVSIYDAYFGGWGRVGGTSVAAPLWAGAYSLVNTAHVAFGLGPIGFVNPALYADALINSTNFDTHDVVYGNNRLTPGSYGFDAGPQYDDCTGLGSLFTPHLQLALLTRPVDDGVAKPSIVKELHASSTATSVTLSWAASATATGYVIEEVVFVDGVSKPFLLPQTVLATTGTSTTFDALDRHTIYEFRVDSINKGGERLGPLAIIATQ